MEVFVTEQANACSLGQENLIWDEIKFEFINKKCNDHERLYVLEKGAPSCSNVLLWLFKRSATKRLKYLYAIALTLRVRGWFLFYFELATHVYDICHTEMWWLSEKEGTPGCSILVIGLFNQALTKWLKSLTIIASNFSVRGSGCYLYI